MLHLKNSQLLRNQSWVNGEWLSQGPMVAVVNPASNAVLSEVPATGVALAETAIVAAQQAFLTWRGTSAQTRSQILHRISELLLEQINDLATLLTAEQGKPLTEARAEITYAASYFSWYAGEALRLYGRLIAAPEAHQRILVKHQPLGVVAAITPWNFPCAMLARKLAPALAAGCTFVAKPAIETPLSALALAYICHEAGVPAGVVNMVTGVDAQAIGEVLTQHPQVAKFTFTGSTQTGKQLLAQCASGVKRTSMELGGNAPFVVFADTHIADAVEGLMSAKFRNAGQTCVSPNRILLERSIAPEFLSQLRARMQFLRVGDGNDPHATIGPLIHNTAANKVSELVASARAAGASVEYFGQPLPGAAFVQPQLVTGVTPTMALFNQEVFGPVVAVTEFDGQQEAVQLANQTPYGLVAYVYTQRTQRIWQMAEQLQFGMLGLNDTKISNAMAPFGGVKESGFGREGGSEGIQDYLNTQYLLWGDCV